jgi:hypothetical protein
MGDRLRFMEVQSRRPLVVAGSAFVLAWFAWFAWDGLLAGFAPDDMMNLYGYWRPGVSKSLFSNLLVGSNAYRPMGAVFYLPLFEWFGLNPLPYRAVVFCVLLLNVGLVFRTARLLGCGEMGAGIAALIACYHAGLADLHYSTATVYDVLCFTFYLAALGFYISRRREGHPLRARDWAGLFALFVGALNSKEMAVTLPVMLLGYEFLYQKQRRPWPALAAGALTAVYILGKKFGADPLMAQEAYRPVFTAARFFESSTLHLNELFYGGYFFGRGRAILLWIAVAGLVFARRKPRPELRFAWLLTWIAPLPIVFLAGRTHSCLYIPLFGWGMLASVLFVDLANLVSLGRPAVRYGAMGAGVALLAWTTAVHKRHVLPQYAGNGALTEEVIRQFQEANPKAEPGSQVLLVDDPFQDWDARFIAELWFRDRTVTVCLQNKLRFSEEEIHKEMKRIYKFEGGRIVEAPVAGFRLSR